MFHKTSLMRKVCREIPKKLREIWETRNLRHLFIRMSSPLACVVYKQTATVLIVETFNIMGAPLSSPPNDVSLKWIFSHTVASAIVTMIYIIVHQYRTPNHFMLIVSLVRCKTTYSFHCLPRFSALIVK